MSLNCKQIQLQLTCKVKRNGSILQKEGNSKTDKLVCYGTGPKDSQNHKAMEQAVKDKNIRSTAIKQNTEALNVKLLHLNHPAGFCLLPLPHHD